MIKLTTALGRSVINNWALKQILRRERRPQIPTCLRCYKAFYMLNSAAHEIYSAHKY